jgi:2-epi-5-epi-valiolone synthase
MNCSLNHAYDVEMATRLLDPADTRVSHALADRGGLVVVDSGFHATHREELLTYLEARLPHLPTHTITISEEAKQLDTVLDICRQAQRRGLARRDVLVAVGGGVCCDVVSVAATLIRRGLPYLTIPTTLLAQVDAGIGLKGAVNFDGSKNYLGCFRPPTAVFVDPGFLTTLPEVELRSGMAEMVKIAMVRDADLLRELRRHGPSLLATGFRHPPDKGNALIERSIMLMLDELAQNPFEETELRRLADFGHTFSTRFEEASRWQLRHGEAVALDMALSGALSVELGMLPDRDFADLVLLLRDLGLPVVSPLVTHSAVREGVRAAVLHRAGRLNLVVPERGGTAAFVTEPSVLTSTVISRALERLTEAARRCQAALPSSSPVVSSA